MTLNKPAKIQKNVVAKGEAARFQKSSAAEASESVYMWEKG